MAASMLLVAVLAALAECRGDGIILFSAYGIESETALTGADFERAASMSLATLVRLESEHGAETDKAMHSARKFEGDLAGVSLSASDVLIYGSGAGGWTSSSSEEGRTHKNAVRDTDMLWPDAIVPYAVNSRFGQDSRAVIASGMAELQEKTCVRFVPRDKDKHKDYVYITSKSGCFSHLGRTGRGRQILSLDTGGCVFKGIVEHELLHALGFLHEQSRTDRDEYIEILQQNIRRGMESQFKKYPAAVITDLGTAYDYGSVLHYGARAFSRNGEPTIRARRAGVGFGQREGVSDNDVLKVNRLYKCRANSDGAGRGAGSALLGVLAGMAGLVVLLLLACLCYRWLNHRWPDVGTVKRLAKKCVTPSEWSTSHDNNGASRDHQAEAQTNIAPVPTRGEPNVYGGHVAATNNRSGPGAAPKDQYPQDPSHQNHSYPTSDFDDDGSHYASASVAGEPHYDTPAESMPPPLPAKPPVAASQPGRVRSVAARFDAAQLAYGKAP